LKNSGYTIDEVFSPNADHARNFAEKFECVRIDKLEKINPIADLYLIAVADGQVADVMQSLPPVEGIVAHTSGHVSINVLTLAKRFGVFYPLQTFTQNRETDMTVVPFCIEASDEQVLKSLMEAAANISRSVHHINSHQRKFLHLAAVTVNNFSNHLYHLAEEFLEDRNLDFNLLKPLILESARKVQDMLPAEAQTGPARRGDGETIVRNLEMLEGNEDFQDLYQLLSEQIMKKYHE
jgi:predicted short-subunit dehydrogenase-like oxidoreductase (DUF2520 family)